MAVVGMALVAVGFLLVVPKGALPGSVAFRRSRDDGETSPADAVGETLWERKRDRVRKASIGAAMMIIGFVVIETTA